jgi:hypothetical protein
MPGVEREDAFKRHSSLNGLLDGGQHDPIAAGFDVIASYAPEPLVRRREWRLIRSNRLRGQPRDRLIDNIRRDVVIGILTRARR